MKAMLLAALIAAASAGKSATYQATAKQKPAEPSATSAPRAAATTPAPGRNGFIVLSADLKTDRYRELASDFAQDDPLQELAKNLNDTLDLPMRLGLRYAECEEPNAYYDPEAREISLCFELIEQLVEDFSGQFDDDDAMAEAVAGAYIFILLHEVAHALIDVLDLPITGREEDVADQLSAWLLIGEEEGNAAVLDAANSFAIAGEQYEAGESDFADEHSLDQQRYYNMVCWVYGSDEETHAALADSAGLPEARAERCAEEYRRLDRSWSKLLEDHVRE